MKCRIIIWVFTVCQRTQNRLVALIALHEINTFGKYCIYIHAMLLGFRGRGIFVTFFQNAKVVSAIHLNTNTSNLFSIKHQYYVYSHLNNMHSVNKRCFSEVIRVNHMKRQWGTLYKKVLAKMEWFMLRTPTYTV